MPPEECAGPDASSRIVETSTGLTETIGIGETGGTVIGREMGSIVVTDFMSVLASANRN